jgi:hypothetical protein
MPPEDPLDRLHDDLSLKRLNPLWAKLEIVFGLTAAGGGLLLGVSMSRRPDGGEPLFWGAALALFVLGGYLAMAGHRSHLYQSNNRLAAHLAALVRERHAPNER